MITMYVIVGTSSSLHITNTNYPIILQDISLVSESWSSKTGILFRLSKVIGVNKHSSPPLEAPQLILTKN